MTREPIYAALYARFAAIAGFVTSSRILQHWADVPATQQPALYQAQRREVAKTTPGLPTVWEFHVDVYVYVNTAGDKTIAPATLLNPLLDSITASLAPEVVSGKCRLGGLVEHAWIEGQIETDEGTLGDQAVAIVPIVIKVTQTTT